MAAAKVLTLLLWTSLFSALLFGGCGVSSQEDARLDGTQSNAVAAELDQFKSEIHQLEVRLGESDKIVKSKDEAIEKLKNVVQEKSDSIAQLQSEILSIQKKGKSDVEERVGKAYAQAAEIQNEVDRIKKELEIGSEEKSSLKSQANEAEKKFQELNLKLKNLQKVTDEQQAKINRLERALQVAEEEMLKATLEASSRIKELSEVHGAWLPPWFVKNTLHFQTFILTEWNEHGKPAMDVLTHKMMETNEEFQKWSIPHIKAIKTAWVPAIQEQWLIIGEYLKPHVQLVSTKTAEAYEASKTTIKPHMIKAKELADPYYQEIKKFSKPYVEQVANMAKPHLEKAHVVLKPYTKNALDIYGKFQESATAYHHQIQITVKEKMEKHEVLREVATKELVYLVESALLALPVIILLRICSGMFCTSRSKKASSHSHPHHHGRRKHKRDHGHK